MAPHSEAPHQSLPISSPEHLLAIPIDITNSVVTATRSVLIRITSTLEERIVIQPPPTP